MPRLRTAAHPLRAATVMIAAVLLVGALAAGFVSSSLGPAGHSGHEHPAAEADPHPPIFGDLFAGHGEHGEHGDHPHP